MRIFVYLVSFLHPTRIIGVLGQNLLICSYHILLNNMSLEQNLLICSFHILLNNLSLGQKLLICSYHMPLNNMSLGQNLLIYSYNMLLNNMSLGQNNMLGQNLNIRYRFICRPSVRYTNKLAECLSLLRVLAFLSPYNINRSSRKSTY